MARPLALAALAALVALPGAATAASETYAYQGGSLVAVFDHKDGCTRTTTTVLAAEDVTGQGADGDSLAIVSVVVLDTCAGTVKRNAYGAAVPKTLKVSDDLKTGSLVATVPVHDEAKDDDYKLKLDLTWEKDGAKAGIDEAFAFGVPGVAAVEGEVDGTAAPAAAKGKVLKGDKDFAVGSADAASIMEVEQATVTVTTES